MAMMSAIFSFSQLFTILPVWKRINQLRIQLSFIEISSHPSNKLLQHLQEAKALQHVISHAGNLTCPLYQCFQQAGSARPAFTVHSREASEVLCFDMCQTRAIHLVDEAFRFHIADVVKESHSPFTPSCFHRRQGGPICQPTNEKAQGSQNIITGIVHEVPQTQGSCCCRSPMHG